MSVSMNSVGSGVSEDEEEQDEDEKLVYDDDEEDVDEINHTHLHKEVVHTHSPFRRVRGTPVCQYLRSIVKHNVTDRDSLK